MKTQLNQAKLWIIAALLSTTACQTANRGEAAAEAEAPRPQVIETDIKTPEQALAALRQGNERFTARKLFDQDYLQQVSATKGEQLPYAVVLSCLDSRVPPEIIFDQGIGDIFVGRVAGNIEDVNVLGSLEFASQVKKTKALVVMGHTNCGAVIGACQDVKLGHLTALLAEIKPAVKAVEAKHKHLAKDSPEFYDLVSEENVRKTIADIRKRSPIIAGLEKEGKLQVVGAMYDVATGVVRFL